MITKRPPRLQWIYTRHPLFFVTACTWQRRPLLNRDSTFAAFRTFAERAEDHGVYVGKYVLMPDHLHLFVAFRPESATLSSWMKSLKNSLSKELRTESEPAPHWQRGFFDHVLRTGESYSQKWDYVEENPVRAGLVTDAADWPFQGEVCELRFD